MRTLSFIALAALACGTAFAATHPEITTYVDGNIADMSPNTGATLAFPDDVAMYLHAGRTTVPVAYSAITKADLGPVKSQPRDSAAGYKVWKHMRRSSTQTRFVTLEYTSPIGESKNMTLEMPPSAAVRVVATIEGHGAKGADATSQARGAMPKSDADWWGNSLWKTTRNADQWKPASPVVAAK